jgi:predicted Rossmann fold nucleotide-binding protein DprA/Smf involved in DNA uptake
MTGSGGLADALEDLELDPEDIRRQLARSAHLGFELERLASRGIGILTVIDDGYPARLRDRLGSKAPPVLFTAGDVGILDAGGLAIVGSRDVDAAGEAFAESVASAAARDNRVVVSGGARGVDRVAMAAAFAAGGRVAGLLPEGIERRLREPSTRAALADGQVALASPYNPTAPFSAGAAMGRNRLIYALADVAVIVACAAESGGTWAGAVDAIKGRWVPVYVRTGPGAPAGNELLIGLGARPLLSPEAPTADQRYSKQVALPEAH